MKPVATTRYSGGDRPIRAAAALLLIAAAPLVHAQQSPVSDEALASRIVALDPRWTVSFAAAPAAPAGYDQQFAYVPLKDGMLVAIDVIDGRIVWRMPLDAVLTPATGDGLVFAASAREVIALEQVTGTVQWRTPLPDGLAAPLYWDTGWLIASTAAGDLVALHAQDGRVLWRQPLGSPLAVVPTPAGDRLYVALADGRIAALALDTGEPAWSVSLSEPVTGLLALDDQLMVGTRKNLLRSLSLRDGRIRWSQRAGADPAGAPVADDRRIYFAALDNVLRAIDRRTGNLRWSRKLPSRPAAGPLKTGELVLVPFVTTEIAAFDAATGQPAFTIRAAGEIGGVPFVREGSRPTAPMLIAMSREGALQGFAPRFEPPMSALGELPGIKVSGG
jgi:outer membrane protein assembly factor BamB